MDGGVQWHTYNNKKWEFPSDVFKTIVASLFWKRNE